QRPRDRQYCGSALAARALSERDYRSVGYLVFDAAAGASQNRPRMQPGSPEAVLAAIAQSGNAMTQGWMRLLSSPPVLERNSALQTEYLEQQAKLWSALLAGGKESLVDDEDRRFAA